MKAILLMLLFASFNCFAVDEVIRVNIWQDGTEEETEGVRFKFELNYDVEDKYEREKPIEVFNEIKGVYDCKDIELQMFVLLYDKIREGNNCYVVSETPDTNYYRTSIVVGKTYGVLNIDLYHRVDVRDYKKLSNGKVVGRSVVMALYGRIPFVLGEETKLNIGGTNIRIKRVVNASLF